MDGPLTRLAPEVERRTLTREATDDELAVRERAARVGNLEAQVVDALERARSAEDRLAYLVRIAPRLEQLGELLAEREALLVELGTADRRAARAEDLAEELERELVRLRRLLRGLR